MNCDFCGETMIRITKDGKTTAYYYCPGCGSEEPIVEAKSSTEAKE